MLSINKGKHGSNCQIFLWLGFIEIQQTLVKILKQCKVSE